MQENLFEKRMEAVNRAKENTRKKFHTAEEIVETICNDPQVCRIVDLPVYYELETNNGNRDYRI